MARNESARAEEQSETRHRILREAANLFAEKGYAATTTREIAAAVGVQQPSLFHHFGSKQEILDNLLRVSIEATACNLKELVRTEGSPAQRLMAHLFLDARHILSCPYNLLGLHADDVLLGDFGRWRAKLDEVHRGIRHLVRSAVEEREFVPVEPEFAQWTLTGGTIAIIRIHGGVARQRPERKAWQASRLLTRMYLTKPEELDACQRGASEIARRVLRQAAPSDPSTENRK
ncbi:TetR/AcrR family transcriptional regulator [Microbispora bryophytorum]|uniref:TetR/AcrR family transcriptional regulator n=1 Tax=Microbispora bryophytorum TaxID=1460882 RepID=UPI0033EF3D25